VEGRHVTAPGAAPGSEYTAKAFRQACERLSVTQSMGRPGSVLDNAVIESWHSTMEFELRREHHSATRAAARAGVAAWIEDYNTARRHSALGMRSPVAYEQALTAGGAWFCRPSASRFFASDDSWPPPMRDPDNCHACLN